MGKRLPCTDAAPRASVDLAWAQLHGLVLPFNVNLCCSRMVLLFHLLSACMELVAPHHGLIDRRMESTMLHHFFLVLPFNVHLCCSRMGFLFRLLSAYMELVAPRHGLIDRRMESTTLPHFLYPSCGKTSIPAARASPTATLGWV